MTTQIQLYNKYVRGNHSIKYYMFPLSDQKIEFASFLEAMHDHSQVENPEKELLNAFKSHDRERRGYVNASEVQHIMLSMGERLSRQEGKEIREKNH